MPLRVAEPYRYAGLPLYSPATYLHGLCSLPNTPVDTISNLFYQRKHLCFITSSVPFAERLCIYMTKWIAYYGCGDDYYGYVEEEDRIIDESFRQFLDVCWPHVDYFTFSSCRDVAVSEERRYGDFCELKKELTPFFAGRTTRNEWFGYGFSNSKQAEICIYRYKASKEAKEIILSCYRDIFFQFPVERPSIEQLRAFDDLCLFNQGKLFYGSVCHEYEAYLYPLTMQMRSVVASLGKWSPCEWRDERDRRDIHQYNWTDEPTPI